MIFLVLVVDMPMKVLVFFNHPPGDLSPCRRVNREAGCCSCKQVASRPVFHLCVSKLRGNILAVLQII